MEGKIYILLLLEIGPSNLNTNIFILIKLIQKDIFGTGGKFLYFIYKTNKQKYQYFHVLIK